MKTFIVPMVLSLGVISYVAQAKSLAPLVSERTGEVVVKIKKGMMNSFLSKSAHMKLDLKKKMNLLSGDFVVVKSSQKSTATLLKEVRGLSEVDYAEPNFIYKAIGQASADPLFGKLWGLSNKGNNEPNREGEDSNSEGVVGADVNAEKAWEITKGSKKIVVAVIDTGIDYTHPDLKENIWINSQEIPGNKKDDDKNGFIDDVHGWNASAGHGDPMDGNAHGTHCAGTIGAVHDNGQGVAGVMSEVSLMAVKFLNDDGSGNLSDAIEAIDYATKMNVDIMNNSWGGGGFSQALHDSIEEAKKKGILFVAAAGNDGTNNDSIAHYPSNYQISNVISVAAHTNQDSLASFSCYGSRTVHVAAPGYNILSTTPNNSYKVFSGTSMATPHVSGVLGLYLTQFGREDVSRLREKLMLTTVPGGAYRKTSVSGGRVDAYNFLTDTRIPRQTPDRSAWKVEALKENFETSHPYANDAHLSKTLTFPGAKYVKLIVEKYETEKDYDFLILKDSKGSVIEKLSGKGANYETDYTEGESLTIEFTSDATEARYGVMIKSAMVIY